MLSPRRLLPAALVVLAATTACTAGRTLNDRQLPEHARDLREALPGDAAVWVRLSSDGWRELQQFLGPMAGPDAGRGLTEYVQKPLHAREDRLELTGPRLVAQTSLLLDADASKSGFDPSRPVLFAFWSIDSGRLLQAASLGTPAEAQDVPRGIATTVLFGAQDPKAWAAHVEKWWAAQPLAEQLVARVLPEDGQVRLVVLAAWPGGNADEALQAFMSRPKAKALRLTPAMASFLGDPADLAVYAPLENARGFALAQSQLHADQKWKDVPEEERFGLRLRTASLASKAQQMLEPSQAEVEDYAFTLDAAPGQGIALRGLSTHTAEGRRLAELSPPPRELPALRAEGAIATLNFASDTEAAFAAVGPVRGYTEITDKNALVKSSAAFWAFLRSPMAVMAPLFKKDERLSATGSLTALHLRVYPSIGSGDSAAIPRAAAILSFRDEASADRNLEKIREWAKGPLQSFFSVDRPKSKKGEPPLVTVGALAVPGELREGPEATVKVPAGLYLEVGAGALEALGSKRTDGLEPALALLRKGAFVLQSDGDETVTRYSVQVGAPPAAPEAVQWRFDPLQHSADGVECRLHLAEKSAPILDALASAATGERAGHVDALYAVVDGYQSACGKEEDTAARAAAARERLSRLRADVAKQDALEKEKQKELEREVPPPPPAAEQAPRAPEPRVKVVLPANAPVKGPKDAKVTVVIFSDFECPFCARVENTLAQLEERYPDDVRFVFMHQPLPFHRNAKPAAQAAVAAQRQGKFWEYKDLLFEDIRNLSDEALVERARRLGLDVARFEKDRRSDSAAKQVEDDIRRAAKYGAHGTPTFFVNGQKVVGAQPLDRFIEVVEEERRRADALLARGVKPKDLYAKLIEDGLEEVPAPPPPSYAAQPAKEPAAYQHVVIPPKATRVHGDKNALVTVVEFVSYPCPFCARAEPTMQAMEKKYGKNLRRVVVHNPLPFHQNAKEAAVASMFASQKGKGAQMHALLMENNRQLSPAELEGYAERLRLSVKELRTALESETWKAELERQIAQARSVGASGTPTFFINGRRIVGAQPQETFDTAIEEELARAKAALKKGVPRAKLYETLSAGPNDEQGP